MNCIREDLLIYTTVSDAYKDAGNIDPAECKKHWFMPVIELQENEHDNGVTLIPVSKEYMCVWCNTREYRE